MITGNYAGLFKAMNAFRYCRRRKPNLSPQFRKRHACVLLEGLQYLPRNRIQINRVRSCFVTHLPEILKLHPHYA